MSQPRPENALDKLAALRKGTRDLLRQDLFRLNQLCAEAERTLRQAEGVQAEFLDEIRHSEQGNVALFADKMRDRRLYLAHLQQRITEAVRSNDEVRRQQAKAQEAFEKCHKEILTLERLSEQRSLAVKQERQRLGYLQADDEELIRHQRLRGDHEFN